MVELTPAQRRVVDHDGDLFLLACPGSGKTRAAAARVARLANERRLAVCSYTNVGAHRIAKVLRDDFDTVLGPEHFLGTIHTFLLRYVLYPFAPLMSCKGRPHVREGEWPTIAVGGNQKKRVGIDAFRCAPDGSLWGAKTRFESGNSRRSVPGAVRVNAIFLGLERVPRSRRASEGGLGLSGIQFRGHDAARRYADWRNAPGKRWGRREASASRVRRRRGTRGSARRAGRAG